MTAALLLLALAAAESPGTQTLDAIFARAAAEQAKFTEPANPRDKEWVKRKLKNMVAVDQIIREAMSDPVLSRLSPQERNEFTRKLAVRMGETDRANTAALKELLAIYRWIAIGEFGKDADGDAWLLVQHADADPAFQQQVLAILTELYPKGETTPSHYAYLWDRVAGKLGKPQRYGTQGRCTAPETWEPSTVEDPANLDSRRATVGLPPMSQYRQVFKDQHLCP